MPLPQPVGNPTILPGYFGGAEGYSSFGASAAFQPLRNAGGIPTAVEKLLGMVHRLC